MRSRQDTPVPVTWDQVNAFRLARHHLTKRAPARALVSVVHDMAGAQAQLPSAAQISLGCRIRSLHIPLIDQALSERSLVKASCMRRTLFLVPAEHLAIYVRGSARRAAKEIRWMLGKGVPALRVEAAIDAALEVLDQPRTRGEIAERVSRALGVNARAIHGGGWGNRRKIAGVPVGPLTFPVVDLLNMVASRGVVCYGPQRGKEPTFVRADAWIPHWHDTPVEQAEDLLLRAYLRAFGPATPEDFSVWAGLRFSEGRQIWGRAQAALAPVDVQGWAAEVLRQDLNKLVKAAFERPLVRLLPYFDTFLLAHKDRQHLAPVEHHPQIYRPQGWIAPVVLVNGRIAAVWEHTRQRDRLNVKVSRLAPLSRSTLAGIRHEAQELARLLEAPDVDVIIS